MEVSLVNVVDISFCKLASPVKVVVSTDFNDESPVKVVDSTDFSKHRL